MADEGQLLLSILIPAYNAQKYIGGALESLARQGFEDEVEVIVVDDGSSDETGPIADTFAAVHDYVQVIHIANAGVAHARNVGLARARGRYIAWLDSDDYLTDDWYAQVKPYLAQNVDMVYFDMWIVGPDTKRVLMFDKHSRVMSPEELMQELANGDRIMSHLCSKITLRSFWTNISFPEDTSCCEDYRVLHQVAVKMQNIYYLHAPLYCYWQHDDSIVHDVHKKWDNLVNYVGYARERRDFLRAHGYAVSDFGVLYAKFSFVQQYYLDRCQGLPEEYQKNLTDYRHDIRRHGFLLLRAKHLTSKMRVKLLIVLIGAGRALSNLRDFYSAMRSILR